MGETGAEQGVETGRDEVGLASAGRTPRDTGT